jgi:predicted transposase YdaD
MSSQKPFDDAFKEIAEHAGEAMLQLIGALPPGARIVELLPREVSAQALLPDQPFKIEDANGMHIAHLEAETRYKHDLMSRVAGYQTRLWLDHQLPVYTYVLVFSPAGMPRRPPTRLTIKIGHLTVVARCEIIRLWTLSAKGALAFGNENLLTMLPLMDGGREELEQAARMLRNIPDQPRRRKLAADFLMLGSLRYRKPDLLNLLLGDNDMLITLDILRETPLFQEVMAEEREEGREEGRRIFIDAIAQFIDRRFPGSPPVEEIGMIRDLAALKTLLLELDQFSDLEMFRRRVLDLIPLEGASSKMD